MSYEGRHEFLCANGHYLQTDAYAEEPPGCSYCGQPLAWFHSIDDTNGFESDNPSTYPAEKLEVGFDDRWLTDHHGNCYAQKVCRYLPGASWRPLSEPGSAESGAT